MFFTLNKNSFIKFIYIVLLFFLLSLLFIFIINLLTLKNLSKTNPTIPQKNINTIETSSLPISNKTIILDAGHGLPDGGAVSNNASNIIESSLNLNIVFKLQELLELSNINVILTRSDENGIYEETSNSIRDKKISDMKNRVQISKDYPADLFISIHMNKLENTSVKGFQVFYSPKHKSAKHSAKYIQDNLNNSIDEFKNTKKIKEIDGIYLTKHIEIPFILIECGFISNEFETNLLTQNDYQEKIAWGIYSGIIDSLNNPNLID